MLSQKEIIENKALISFEKLKPEVSFEIFLESFQRGYELGANSVNTLDVDFVEALLRFKNWFTYNLADMESVESIELDRRCFSRFRNYLLSRNSNGIINPQDIQGHDYINVLGVKFNPSALGTTEKVH